jgi:hypothetical protein
MEAGSGSAVIDGSIVKVETHETSVAEYHRKASDVAGLVKAIVLGKAIQVSGRKYVPVDAYQAIANAMGCVASARDVKRVEGGYTAIGEVRRLSDGKVMAEGEGFVGDDEPKWAKGPEYARRAMVQTRAIGRACRAAFAFVVPMIDLGLSSTPAEEMEGVAGSETPPPPTQPRALVDKLRPPETKAAPQSNGKANTGRHFVPPFANEDEDEIRELTDKKLLWYEEAFQKSVDDPAKAKWKANNEEALGWIRDEIKHRGL